MESLYIKNSILITLLLSTTLLFGIYPEVSIKNSDILYKQIQSDLLENSKRIMENRELLPVQFYIYHIKDDDSIFTVSSRFNLSYDTIASLNKIENQLFFNSREHIYIPNCQGLYLENELYDDGEKVIFEGKSINFFPGKTFSGKERLEFLITPFKSPLKSMNITSGFGNRENPFTQNNEFHSGLDLKATIGTKVFSPYSGKINNTGYSDFYGNYLIIVHGSGYSTHYYHLNSIDVEIGDVVEKGEYVATTGNSGRSTGPHLHFEIHRNNEAIDPRVLLGDV